MSKINTRITPKRLRPGLGRHVRPKLIRKSKGLPNPGKIGILGEPVRIGLAPRPELYAYNYVTTYGTCVNKCKKVNDCKTNNCDNVCIKKCRKVKT